MKTYKYHWQQINKEYYKLTCKYNDLLEQSNQRKLALEQCNIPDPVQVDKYYKSLDVLLNLYYTMNQARPEWELVKNTLVDLGEICVQ